MLPADERGLDSRRQPLGMERDQTRARASSRRPISPPPNRKVSLPSGSADAQVRLQKARFVNTKKITHRREGRTSRVTRPAQSSCRPRARTDRAHRLAPSPGILAQEVSRPGWVRRIVAPVHAAAFHCTSLPPEDREYKLASHGASLAEIDPSVNSRPPLNVA
jgi:hypothetical protein